MDLTYRHGHGRASLQGYLKDELRMGPGKTGRRDVGRKAAAR